jgi:hypothetical protein
VLYTAVGAVNIETGVETRWKPQPGLAPGDPYFYASILSVAVADGRIYVVGGFNQMNGQLRHSLAAFSEATGELLDWNPNEQWKPQQEIFAAEIEGIKVVDGIVYLAGAFTSFAGKPSNGLAAVHGTTGAVLQWEPNSLPWKDPYHTSNMIVGAGKGAIFLRGRCASIGEAMELREGFVELDQRTGSVTTWNPALKSIVHDTVAPHTIYGITPIVRVQAMAVSGSTLYIGGMFDSVQGEPRARLAAFDLSTHTLLPWNPRVTGRTVTSLASSDGIVYAAGYFSAVGDSIRRFVAAIDAVSGDVLPWRPVVDTSVKDIAIQNDRVYMGGVFSNVNGVARNGFAVVDVLDGATLEEGPVLPAGANVERLVLGDSIVYLTGTGLGPEVTPLTNYPSFYSPSLGGYSLRDGSVVWTPKFGGTRKAMHGVTMQLAGSRLYTGGDILDRPNDTVASYRRISAITCFDALQGTELLAQPLVFGQQGGYVKAMAIANDSVYAGGSFSYIGDYRMPYFAEFIPQYPASVTAYQKLLLEHTVALYPNPASVSLTIDCGSMAMPATLSIMDILGREVQQLSILSERITLSVEHLSNGTYFIRAGNVTRPFVVAR